jgi:hypothetical protein
MAIEYGAGLAVIALLCMDAALLRRDIARLSRQMIHPVEAQQIKNGD